MSRINLKVHSFPNFIKLSDYGLYRKHSGMRSNRHRLWFAVNWPGCAYLDHEYVGDSIACIGMINKLAYSVKANNVTD